MSNTEKKISSLFPSNISKTKNISPEFTSQDERDNQGRFLCGDLDITIDQEGTWYYNNTPIGRKELVRLFSSVIQRDQDNNYWLVTPAEKGKIYVEDVPFMAVELTVSGAGKYQSLKFRTNIDEFVEAGVSNPITFINNQKTGEPSPYVLVRDNLEAKLTRAVYYQLVGLGIEEQVADRGIFGVWSKGEFFEIGEVEA